MNLDSPHLQRWMREFTDVIEKETGIRPTPGTQLSEREKHRVYNVWLRHLVPMVEDPNRRRGYGDIRDQIIESQGGRGDLGSILQGRGAVCRELSMCASVLFSEYGIRSNVVTGNVNTGLIRVRNNKGQLVELANENRRGSGHAWLQVYDENGRPVEIVDSNFTRNIHPDYQDYNQAAQGAVSNKETNLVRPQ